MKLNDISGAIVDVAYRRRAQLGLLINFGAPSIENGIVRIANGVVDEPPVLRGSERE